MNPCWGHFVEQQVPKFEVKENLLIKNFIKEKFYGSELRWGSFESLKCGDFNEAIYNFLFWAASTRFALCKKAIFCTLWTPKLHDPYWPTRGHPKRETHMSFYTSRDVLQAEIKNCNFIFIFLNMLILGLWL